MFAWLSENLDILVPLLSAVVAVIAAFISSGETRKQRQLQLENLRHGLDAQSLGWGNACIDVMNRAAMFARTRQHQQNDAAFLQNRVNLMLAISSLIERGRLFFPNLEPEQTGFEREGAYRGQRAPILDALVFAYYEIEHLTRQGGPTADNSADFIDQCRRLFVSELQAHFDPRRRDMIVGRYKTASRDGHHREALVRAKNLREMLSQRRPGIKFEREESVQ